MTILDFSWSKVDSISLLRQQTECVAEGIMTLKVKIVAVLPICTVLITALGTVAGFAARADDEPFTGEINEALCVLLRSLRGFISPLPESGCWSRS